MYYLSAEPKLPSALATLCAPRPTCAKSIDGLAALVSMVETAKENGLIPFQYLTFLFENLLNIDTKARSGIGKLLPASSDLPQKVRLPLKE